MSKYIEELMSPQLMLAVYGIIACVIALYLLSVAYVFIDAKTLLESVKSGNVTNAAQFFQIHAPRTLRTTEILLDEQGVAVSFRAPMAVQDETGKSMLEEKKSK